MQKGDGIKLRREDGVWEYQSAFNSMLTNYTIENTEGIHDPKVFLESKRSIIRNIVKQDLQLKYALKMNMVLHTIVENPKGEASKWAFRTSNREVFMDTDVDETLSEIYEHIMKKFSEKLLDGSW
jgi:phage pi2 protein 07